MQSKYKIIRDIILRNIPGEGNYPCTIKGVKLARRDNPNNFLKCFYNPACVFVLQGKKHVLYGNENIIYKEGQYVVSCADIPITSRILEAWPDKPFVVLILEFDSDLISNLLLEAKTTHATEYKEQCFSVADIDDNLLDALYRLALLIEQPKDEILSSMVIKEIYYRLLIGPLGSQLKAINTKGTSSNQIARAITFLKENFNKKLNIEDVAKYVNMAPSSFYRNFKKITRISPLQYQKQLRLQEAQRLMLSGKYNAEAASCEVGYQSPVQFNREYKKMFKNPPKKDIKNLSQT